MRESNFAFPAQNKACVCITSQLYDRRALDTTSPLPLFNSLTHLTYLTSTSPRIREIMTMDGGLERLVRILHEFCMCPPPPENPANLYGLTPPNSRPPKLSPALNPHTFDKHAAYRFSLAFQCVVNIGVRGSEPIRSRVVQAGTLDVVGCILEAWLANKGFAVGPSSSATGMPRETREQRQIRRIAQLEQRQREEAAHLQKALQRQLQVDHTQNRNAARGSQRRTYDEQEDSMDYSPAEGSTSHILLLSDSVSQPSNSNSDTDVSTDTSIAATPVESGTPTGSVLIPSRDRSGTIIARPIWDHPATTPPGTAIPPRGRRLRHRELPPESPSPSTDASRPDTETEDDGDGDIDMDRTDDGQRMDSDVASASASPSPERRPRNLGRLNHARRAVGIVSDEPDNGTQTLQVGLNTDAHIIINEAGGVGDGGVGVEVGVEDGIVSLEPNDDFAMGAPPGAPGAIGEGTTPRVLNLTNMETGRRRNTVDAPDATPRAAVVGLPMMAAVSTNGTIRGQQHAQAAAHGHQRNATIRGRPTPAENATAGTAAGAAAAAAAATASINMGGGRTSSGTNHHHRDSDSGPYRDEDVLLSLQLLAYLSKYPHVRQAFYKPRVTFHPASVNLPGARFGVGASPSPPAPPLPPAARERQKEKEKASATSSGSSSSLSKEGFFRAFTNVASGNSRGKERAQPAPQSPVVATPTSAGGAPSSSRQTNVFSLVERFTFKPSSTETDLPNPPPRLPPEIQYWAGVIMRNACRKDDNRGGIRQCANMLCGKWETYPREFAKCRRCRKAKYCGKECQSTAWSEGHRFWCSAKDVDEDNATDHPHLAQANQSGDLSGIHIAVEGPGAVDVSVQVTNGNGPRPERRHTRERQHGQNNGGEGDTSTVRYRPAMHGAHPTAVNAAYGGSPTTSVIPSPTARAESSMSRDRTVQPQAPHIRTRPTLHPTNVSYLSFHIQSTTGRSQQESGGQRRRADTVTGASLSNRSMTTTDVAPNVIPAPQRHAQHQHAHQHQHPHQPQMPTTEWTMGGSTTPSAGPSRRHRLVPRRSPPAPEDDRDDMVLG
ncbi:hypothetical protein B0H34DRAFT_791603 [Crassisporium funariophilum]|nr:hypothetical protein B0H34DRAFT_791603 [Crassisporium funariophilum]